MKFWFTFSLLWNYVEELRLNSTTLMIHSERLDHQMSPKLSIFPIWRHKLSSGEYSKTFASNLVDLFKKSYSKLKVAYKNPQKWTKTIIFKHQHAHKAGKMTSLEMTSYLHGKLFSDYGPMISRFLINPFFHNVTKWSYIL